MKHMQLGIRLGDDAVASHHWHFQGHADNCSYPYRYTFLVSEISVAANPGADWRVLGLHLEDRYFSCL